MTAIPVVRAHLLAVATLAALFFPDMAFAVRGAQSAYVPVGGFPRVGRVWDLGPTIIQGANVGQVGRFNPPNSHNGTGTYLGSTDASIGQGKVLTVAHVLNLGRETNAQRRHFGTAYEQFQIGANWHAGLGIQHPTFDRAVNTSGSDIGLILLLNRPPAAGGADPTLAAAGAPPAIGTTVNIVGFTDTLLGNFASNKRQGVMRTQPLVGGFADDFYYPVLIGADPNAPYSYGERGDSGGPHFNQADGQIVAVTHLGDAVPPTDPAGFSPGTGTFGTRVDLHRGFVDGNGAGGVRAIDRFVAGGNTNWSDNTRWRRTSANNQAVPLINDIAVLDPTNGADSGINVAVDVNSADLDGLLTDVTLNIPNAALRITGTVGQANGTAIGTGALNGGVINVGGGGGGQNGNLEVGWSMDNQGTINVLQRGTARFGRSLPSTGFLDTVFWNSNQATLAVNGGTATVDLALRNSNQVSVVDGAMDVGFYLPQYVGNPANKKGPDAVSNGFTVGTLGDTQFSVGANGVLDVTNGASNRTAVFRNHATGDLRVKGVATGPARANIDAVENTGQVFIEGQSNVNTGHLDAHRSFQNLNRGRLEIGNFGYARFGRLLPPGGTDLVLENSTPATISINGGTADVDLRMFNWGTTSVARGTLNAGKFLPEFAGAPIANPDAIINGRTDPAQPAATFYIWGGGVMNVTNLDPKRTAEFDNRRTGVLAIEGDANGAAMANIDRFISRGTVYVNTGGTLNVYGHLINHRHIDVQGGGFGNGNMSGWIQNEPNGRLRVFNGGRVTAQLPATYPVADSLGNDPGAHIAIEGNGEVVVKGLALNEGFIDLRSDANGLAKLSIEPRSAGDTGIFHNLGELDFSRRLGAEKALLKAHDTNLVFAFGSQIRGPGQLVLSGATSVISDSDDVGNDWNNIAIMYDAAFGANNSFVPLEAGSIDSGNVLAGLAQPFALNSLCLSNNSRVRLVDDFFNEVDDIEPEVLYTRFLGIDESSIFDLANTTLYYRRVDPHCGLNLGSFINGQPIQIIPEPATLLLVAIGSVLLPALRRHRGRPVN